MRFVAIILPFLILTGCRSPKQALVTGESSIFREISFLPYDTVVIGEPLPGNPPPTIARGSLLAVTKDGFAGADSIYFGVDEARVVEAMYFVYSSDENIVSSVEDYETMLGPPVRRETTDSAGGTVSRVIWEDGPTKFVMSEFAGREVRRVSSALLEVR